MGRAPAIAAPARGFHGVYRMGETNHCPGCGRTQWHVGRITAECGFCATALPLQDDGRRDDGSARIFRRGRPAGRRSVIGLETVRRIGKAQ